MHFLPAALLFAASMYAFVQLKKLPKPDLAEYGTALWFNRQQQQESTFGVAAGLLAIGVALAVIELTRAVA